eukprot:UN19918
MKKYLKHSGHFNKHFESLKNFRFFTLEISEFCNFGLSKFLKFSNFGMLRKN